MGLFFTPKGIFCTNLFCLYFGPPMVFTVKAFGSPEGLTRDLTGKSIAGLNSFKTDNEEQNKVF